jgi:hypothetical protein
MTMFGMSEDLPEGYERATLPGGFPAGAVAAACTRCGVLIGAAREGGGSPFERHDAFHAALEGAGR